MADVPQRAGWYPDPDGVAGERWWNGAGWSDSRRGGASTVPPQPVVYSAENPAPQYPQAPLSASVPATRSINARLNPMAMYGFIAGLIGVFFNFLLVPSILAIVFSARGLARAKQLQEAGEKANLRVYAIIGLALGILSGIGGIVQAILFVVGVISSIDVSVS